MFRFLLQTRRPLECFAHTIRCGTCKHRNREQAGSHDSQRKKKKRESAGHGLQGQSSLVCRLDVLNTMSMQSGGSGQDDKERYEVGEGHSEIRVKPDSLEVHSRLLRSLFERCFPCVESDLFDFLGCLPEKQVGADRRSENCNQGRKVPTVKRKSWQECRANRLPPGLMEVECGYDICKKCDRQPF